MIQTLRLALLLACCTSALAQPLYKWIEADGSITFSPDKPQKGIDFQVINADDGVTASKIAVRAPKTSAADPTSSAQTSYSQQISDGSSGIAQPLASSYSTGKALNARSLNINELGSNAGQQASMTSMVRQHSGQTIQSSAAMRKQNQCEDLRKRVVSLERRLKSDLTPADMDNTVVHMSQYQRSYDQHCVQ